MEKSQFFKKTLSRIVGTYPKVLSRDNHTHWPRPLLTPPQRVVYQSVLPALRGEFRNHRMIPFVLPIILVIAEDCSLQEYTTHILPILVPAFKIQDPIQVHRHSLTLSLSLASRPHPSVGGLVLTVCACANFLRFSWEFGYHRLLTVYFRSYACNRVCLLVLQCTSNKHYDTPSLMLEGQILRWRLSRHALIPYSLLVHVYAVSIFSKVWTVYFTRKYT